MKRVIRIKSASGTDVKITAEVDSNGYQLMRDEVEEVVDKLADNLMRALLDLPYSAHRISRMRVSR
jgi:hypothetical protein